MSMERFINRTPDIQVEAMAMSEPREYHFHPERDFDNEKALMSSGMVYALASEAHNEDKNPEKEIHGTYSYQWITSLHAAYSFKLISPEKYAEYMADGQPGWDEAVDWKFGDHMSVSSSVRGAIELLSKARPLGVCPDIGSWAADGDLQMRMLESIERDLKFVDPSSGIQGLAEWKLIFPQEGQSWLEINSSDWSKWANFVVNDPLMKDKAPYFQVASLAHLRIIDPERFHSIDVDKGLIKNVQKKCEAFWDEEHVVAALAHSEALAILSADYLEFPETGGLKLGFNDYVPPKVQRDDLPQRIKFGS